MSCSDAILKYLVTKYDIPEHWYPRQPERRARVDEYTAWHHSNTRPHAAKVFILEVHTPFFTGETGSSTWLILWPRPLRCWSQLRPVRRWIRCFWVVLSLSWTTLWTNWSPCSCAGSRSCVAMTSPWRTCWPSVSSCR